MSLRLPTAVPSWFEEWPSFLRDDVAPKCAAKEGSVCEWVWTETESRWLANAVEWLLAKPIQVLLIIIAAMLVRWVLHRFINGLTSVGNGETDDKPADGDKKKKPKILRPFREKASSALLASGLMTERRAQRASTLGSVLRSVTSIIIFVVAGSTILGLFNINLAPLVASAGIAGVALGFGTQSLVRDYLSGIFMILEDQYGVGDIVDLGEAGGTVENIGLRVTTVRDVRGVVWYIRNGEILRVGNKSQGWAQVVIDVPMPFGTDLEKAHEVLTESAARLTEEDDFKDDLLAPPEVLGVEQMTATGMMLRVTVRTTTASQWRVARELRARISADLDAAGIVSGITPTPAPAPPA
ncbi:mechanosensitive ion channel family protein [Cryptosporangium aurantiacum]|uniref:mechanosensitive ion channel family protein n=1 Tax=Cryptosporangium aurantiacum TaxID=134849 RepID=UPI001C49E320|nr:mechanosensitive ion channel family protein [Cryptosporangium aurantiacum]